MTEKKNIYQGLPTDYLAQILRESQSRSRRALFDAVADRLEELEAWKKNTLPFADGIVELVQICKGTPCERCPLYEICGHSNLFTISEVFADSIAKVLQTSQILKEHRAERFAEERAKIAVGLNPNGGEKDK